jgi:hypothetical protein
MSAGPTTFGIVAGEKPPVLHRPGTTSGRSCCGKTIEIRSRDDAALRRAVVCRRCIALDDARRSGMPDWF